MEIADKAFEDILGIDSKRWKARADATEATFIGTQEAMCQSALLEESRVRLLRLDHARLAAEKATEVQLLNVTRGEKVNELYVKIKRKVQTASLELGHEYSTGEEAVAWMAAEIDRLRKEINALQPLKELAEYVNGMRPKPNGTANRKKKQTAK